ncbi:MBL fold metallo-hydrolase [Halarsenatibacter silvermanii]|uniref:L-ascorbate metabolism protein UlaG, beta-lactamase superfamily n=1 Tax=Halarsenatibacter silvermanii TaxID=321763 RepID=A0A1G9QEB0_9FIRM|nr:MBL fold metallo-hydrolase [Halarsenatibacter silvermanii]SDM09230.1 L-ascorbate metabolism protein UlaG, beta-lactamase superfamily [Halarsenatibacter silvermanii]
MSREISLTIWHIYHSGSAVLNHETKNLHIFDYYRQAGSKFPEIWRKNYDINSAYIYVSHSHGDHYDPEIFSWGEKFAGPRYILSSDLRSRTEKYEKRNFEFNYISPGQKVKSGETMVEAYESTDEGISLLTGPASSRPSIFFAGDLNWWDWQSFSEKERRTEEKEYKQVIDKLAGREIDLAFVPVDPRLEESFDLAGRYFIEKVSPKNFVPIHFGDDYETPERFRQKYDGDKTNILTVEEPGQRQELKL